MVLKLIPEPPGDSPEKMLAAFLLFLSFWCYFNSQGPSGKTV